MEKRKIPSENENSRQNGRREADEHVRVGGAPSGVVNLVDVKPSASLLPDYRQSSGLFFDGPKQFDYVRSTVLPVLIRRSHRIYTWNIFCGRGYDAFSLAMLLQEMNPYHQHRITATDTDDDILHSAERGGPYGYEEIKNIDSNLLKKYFDKKEDGYWICDGIKKSVEFKAHDLSTDRYDRGYDLVICRNAGLQFSSEETSDLHRKLYRSLKEGGVLFTGRSAAPELLESLGYVRLSISCYLRLPRRRLIPVGKVDLGKGA